MELWMKNKAAKSFGGSCMSKFVHESERKRIERLKNIKSSIVKSSYRNHDPWTQQRFDKRHRDIVLERKNNDSQEKELVDIKFLVRCEDSETTKSGLKLRFLDKKNITESCHSSVNKRVEKSKTNSFDLVSNKLPLEKNTMEVESSIHEERTDNVGKKSCRINKHREGKENHRDIIYPDSSSVIENAWFLSENNNLNRNLKRGESSGKSSKAAPKTVVDIKGTVYERETSFKETSSFPHERWFDEAKNQDNQNEKSLVNDVLDVTEKDLVRESSSQQLSTLLQEQWFDETKTQESMKKNSIIEEKINTVGSRKNKISSDNIKSTRSIAGNTNSVDEVISRRKADSKSENHKKKLPSYISDVKRDQNNQSRLKQESKNKLAMQPGHSLKSLMKEREQALEILKEISRG